MPMDVGGDARAQSEISTERLPDDHADRKDRRPPRLVLSLLAYAPQGPSKCEQLLPGKSLVVGRASPSDLVLQGAGLSRTHARFSLEGGRIYVEDLGSTNGTHVDGARAGRAEIQISSEVRLGEVEVRVLAHPLDSAPEHPVDTDATFRERLHDEETRARLVGRPFALLAVRVSPEVAAELPLGAWVSHLRERLRPVDRITLDTPDTALVLLPEANLDDARKVAGAIAPPGGRPGPRFLVGIAVCREHATSAEALRTPARDAAKRASAAHPVQEAPAAPRSARPLGGGSVTMIQGHAFAPVVERAKLFARARSSLILRGETGSGKELLAQFIHENSPRKDRAMICVNCGAIPEGLQESTFFGHEKGAFTSAEKKQDGLFQAASGSTLFLDEVAELSPAAQAALLRVLESNTFTPVGATQAMKVDVRVIAATHRDLHALAREGRFREDLLYRLDIETLEIPPLRERVDEIGNHARLSLEKVSQDNGLPLKALSGEALALLRAYPWPGNMRELRNEMEHAAIVARGDTILPEDLRPRVRAARREAPPAPPSSGEGTREGTPPTVPGMPSQPSRLPLRETLRRTEEREITEAMKEAGGNRARAAEALSTPLRTLSRKVKELGLDRTPTDDEPSPPSSRG
ncbi:sigma-54-dependent Fis family transcriptional regulator [Chondromyces apiculatus]|uniref:Response regulator of zinc sigma-54-dependent two-component system n=1 Tax=Chondromyces apiculatus DSM 436 TaxID=1192034 RepID=A0A017ST36_9BACT|nr:sigma-54-dependent Fis family transcriptional regulator [Chondromyces apiculatus]EYF00109.1 Hypothetical protein CAP_1360 [Chondromyces apiculatus DSM 436]